MIGHYVLSQYMNITFSEDKGIAYLQFSKKDENFSCTIEDLESFLHSHNIRYGIQRDIVQRISTNPEEYFFNRVPIAIGQPAVNGIDGRVVLTVDLEEDRKPLEMADGKVDYKDLVRLHNVLKGQIIAKIIPPQPGKSGTMVTGEELPFRPGKEAHFKVGKNVLVDQEETAMYAAIDGLVTLTDKGKINVFPVYEVNGDVDYSTGNIDFVGTVVIRGNVLTGFTVKSAGDIRVVGGVEGADLISGGSIEITGGIIGYNKGLVSAGKNVKVSFIQDGNVVAGEDVIVSQSVMHSNIRAGRDVLCNGAKGLIVGGVVQAGERVVARTIGNTMSTATAIEVGVVPELRNEINELRQELRHLLENEDKTNKALYLLNQLANNGQLSPDKVALRVKLNATKQSHMREEKKIKERILEIEKMLEDTGRARVEVIKTIYGGSKIVIGRYTRFVKDPTERVTFIYSEGDITITPNL
ncbi:FapA family protein [Paenibacillus graminis]|nr:FapA family protein [Paenibacillus graminis]MEC0169989.1 FapA family protein [Paenibacillus graminis]